MYDFNPNTGAQSTTPKASLESHMSQLSKTMVQLAQTNQAMATSQQQNQLALVTAQQQQAEAFNTLATTTEQRKYDTLVCSCPQVQWHQQRRLCSMAKQNHKFGGYYWSRPLHGTTQLS